MNNFGGNWTKIKIEILVEYAQAYLKIMKGRNFYKLMYFDGFAGSGFIIKDKKQEELLRFLNQDLLIVIILLRKMQRTLSC